MFTIPTSGNIESCKMMTPIYIYSSQIKNSIIKILVKWNKMKIKYSLKDFIKVNKFTLSLSIIVLCL
jgi:hypothetical protein